MLLIRRLRWVSLTAAAAAAAAWPHGKDKRSLAAMGMFSRRVVLCMAGHSLGHTPGSLASFPGVTLSPPYLNIPHGGGQNRRLLRRLRKSSRTQKKIIRFIKPLSSQAIKYTNLPTKLVMVRLGSLAKAWSTTWTEKIFVHITPGKKVTQQVWTRRMPCPTFDF